VYKSKTTDSSSFTVKYALYSLETKKSAPKNVTRHKPIKTILVRLFLWLRTTYREPTTIEETKTIKPVADSYRLRKYVNHRATATAKIL